MQYLITMPTTVFKCVDPNTYWKYPVPESIPDNVNT